MHKPWEYQTYPSDSVGHEIQNLGAGHILTIGKALAGSF